MNDEPISKRLRIERRPIPVLPEQRPIYRISLMVLVLRLASTGGRSSLARLHLFNWALKRSDRAEQLVAAAESRRLGLPAWGFDPTLEVALRFGSAEGLVSLTSTGYQLTDKGRQLADTIASSEIYLPEKDVLKSVGKGITEKMVESVSKTWERER